MRHFLVAPQAFNGPQLTWFSRISASALFSELYEKVHATANPTRPGSLQQTYALVFHFVMHHNSKAPEVASFLFLLSTNLNDRVHSKSTSQFLSYMGDPQDGGHPFGFPSKACSKPLTGRSRPLNIKPDVRGIGPGLDHFPFKGTAWMASCCFFPSASPQTPATVIEKNDRNLAI